MKKFEHNLANVTALQNCEECNFYDVKEKISCYKKAIVRPDADSRMLCNTHYKKYKKILKSRNSSENKKFWQTV